MKQKFRVLQIESVVVCSAIIAQLTADAITRHVQGGCERYVGRSIGKCDSDWFSFPARFEL